MASGMSNKAIASALSLAKNTVISHVDNIHSKCQVSNRTEAVVVALQRGWLRLENISVGG